MFSLCRLRYFVMSPSLFRLFAFVFSLSSFRLFVMSPRNNEKTKWHKSATIPMGHNRGNVSDILSDKCTALIQNKLCSESKSRNFDCQWTLVSFLVKHNQFYWEARLTCPLYRSTEDICIGIYVFKIVFNVWHMLKKVCQCNNILNNLWGNRGELNWSLLEIL